MFKSTIGRVAALLLAGSLFSVGCGEGADDYEMPIDLSVTTDAASPAVDAAPSGMGGNDAGNDAGGSMVRMDSGGPAPVVDTGAPVANDAGDAGTPVATGDAGPDAGPGPGGDGGTGMCCPDQNCLCRGEAPTRMVTERGSYQTMSFQVAGAGLVFYPTNAEPPFAAVALADGLGGSGGANGQTAAWGPFYASHGIVAMITTTGSGDQPPVRGMKLGAAITALKAENMRTGSPLFGKLAGRYGTSGYSMGGGGTTHAATADATLKSSIGLAAWRPVGRDVMVPTLFICGASDGTAPCSMSSGAYGQMPMGTPKMWVEIAGGHGAFGRPTADNGRAGGYALAFQKVFLEGDTRWRKILVAAESNATNIQ